MHSEIISYRKHHNLNYVSLSYIPKKQILYNKQLVYPPLPFKAKLCAFSIMYLFYLFFSQMPLGGSIVHDFLSLFSLSYLKYP